MQRWLHIQQKVVPEMMQALAKRYRILRLIRLHQPIGRRTLAGNIGLTERVLRKETDLLKEQGLLSFSPSGMSLTQESELLLPDLEEWMRQWRGLSEVEFQLQQMLSLQNVIVVPGDSYTSPWVKGDLGRAAVEQLKQLALPDSVVAVAGGTTMAAVASNMGRHSLLKTLHYVPARGGLGEDVENQANTICSLMASKAGGGYRLLHVPDQLSKEAYHSLLNDEQIRDIVKLIRSARIVIHGIGEAITMAERRNSTTGFVHMLNKEQAVAEAFGYYFDARGQILHKIQTIGLRLEDMRQATHILSVAGGSNKAKAILAFLKHGVHDVFITDEGAARKILDLESGADHVQY